MVTGLYSNQKIGLLYYTGIPNDLIRDLKIISQCFKSWEVPIKNPEIINNGQHYDKFESSIIFSWLLNPYSQGSYSGYSNGNSTEYDRKTTYKGVQFKETFQPLNDQIYFIGEHTTLLEEIGTMEAAVESAENLMKLF